LTDEDRTLLERWKSIYPQSLQSNVSSDEPQSTAAVTASVVDCVNQPHGSSRDSTEPYGQSSEAYKQGSESTRACVLPAAEQDDGEVVSQCLQSQGGINCIFLSDHVHPSLQPSVSSRGNVSVFEAGGNNVSTVTTSFIPPSSAAAFHGAGYLLPVDMQQSGSFTAALLSASENNNAQFAGGSSTGVRTRGLMGQVQGRGSVGQGHGRVPAGVQGLGQGPGSVGVRGCGSVGQGRGQGRGSVAVQGQGPRPVGVHGRMQGQGHPLVAVQGQVQGRGSVDQGQGGNELSALPAYSEALRTMTLLPPTASLFNSHNNAVDHGNCAAAADRQPTFRQSDAGAAAAAGWISESIQRRRTSETSMGELTSLLVGRYIHCGA